MAAAKEPLGRLLVDAGLLSEDALARALAEQERSGRPLGEIVVQQGYARPAAVASMLERQRSGEVVGLQDWSAERHGGASRQDALERLAMAVTSVGTHARDSEEARATIAELAELRRRLESELEARNRSDELLADRDEQLAGLRAELERATAAHEEAIALLAASAEARAQEVRAALGEYETRLDEELAARADSDGRLVEREDRIAALEADLQRLTAAREEAIASLTAAERTQAEEEALAARAHDESMLTERERRIATLEAELARLSGLETELELASSARDEALASLATVTAFAAARAAEVHEARDEMQARSAETVELRRRLDEEAERRARADGMLAERDERIAALETSLERLTAAREEAVAALATLSAFAGTRGEDLERAQAELAARAAEAAELHRRLEEEVERRGRSEGALAQRDEIESVVARLAQVHAERDEAQAARKLERASEQLRGAEQERADGEARLEAAEAMRLQLAGELETVRAALEQRREDSGPAPRTYETAAHLLFVPARNRYLLVERPGPPPAAGEALELEVDDARGRFRVARIGRAPLPGRGLACAYLEPV